MLTLLEVGLDADASLSEMTTPSLYTMGGGGGGEDGGQSSAQRSKRGWGGEREGSESWSKADSGKQGFLLAEGRGEHLSASKPMTCKVK